MNNRSSIRLRGLLGAAAALAAIAVAVPAISAADRHGDDHHGDRRARSSPSTRTPARW